MTQHLTHYEHQHHDRGGARTSDPNGPEWARTATMQRAMAWAADRIADLGDAHDKGEASLCVGEAA